MIILEEAGLAKKVATGIALFHSTSTSSISTSPTSASPASAVESPHHTHSGGKKQQKKKGNKSGKSPGQISGHGNSPFPSQFSPQQWPSQWAGGSPSWPWQWPWPSPPCPYPTTQWPRPSSAHRPSVQQPGILGSRPHAYSAQAPPTITDIEAAMHTLGITPPDANWYMDTGATSHMTSTQGFSDGDASNEM